MSGGTLDHDPFKPIKLHLELDHYAGDLMLPVPSDETTYEVYRMLPPGKHRYYFTIDGQIVVAQD